MQKIWNVAIYARVSTDKKEQQESIPAQVDSLKKWLIEKSKNDSHTVYNLVDVYEDAGSSGSNFDRDSFIRMKDDIELVRINMVLTRDLSRFARNYIYAGYYLEDYFKVNGVRFVSVLDNVDTLEEFNDIIPFKNILNEMYIKDCSRRVKDALKQRMIRGSSIASKPPYGYTFQVDYQGNVKTIRLVSADDETTEVVRKIFSLFLSGWGYVRIASYLNEDGIQPPATRLNFGKSKFKLWNGNGIKSILTNPKYGGIMVQQRWKKVSYKVKKVAQTDQAEWIYGEDFEGIIDKETFLRVQGIIEKRKTGYRYKGDTIHPFSTVLRCNECSGSMSYRKKYKGYKCTNSQIGAKRCTPHSVKEDYLKQTIIQDLKKYVDRMVNREDMYNQAMEMGTKKDDYKKELTSIESELTKLDNQFHKVYEDKLNEVITQRNFESLAKGIQSRQNSLEKRKAEVLEKKTRIDNGMELFKSYKGRIDRILDFHEFDRATVESLIDKIIVTEDPETRDKSIDVYYKFKA